MVRPLLIERARRQHRLLYRLLARHQLLARVSGVAELVQALAGSSPHPHPFVRGTQQLDAGLIETPLEQEASFDPEGDALFLQPETIGPGELESAPPEMEDFDVVTETTQEPPRRSAAKVDRPEASQRVAQPTPPHQPPEAATHPGASQRAAQPTAPRQPPEAATRPGASQRAAQPMSLPQPSEAAADPGASQRAAQPTAPRQPSQAATRPSAPQRNAEPTRPQQPTTADAPVATTEQPAGTAELSSAADTLSAAISRQPLFRQGEEPAATTPQSAKEADHIDEGASVQGEPFAQPTTTERPARESDAQLASPPASQAENVLRRADSFEAAPQPPPADAQTTPSKRAKASAKQAKTAAEDLPAKVEQQSAPPFVDPRHTSAEPKTSAPIPQRQEPGVPDARPEHMAVELTANVPEAQSAEAIPAQFEPTTTEVPAELPTTPPPVRTTAPAKPAAELPTTPPPVRTTAPAKPVAELPTTPPPARTAPPASPAAELPHAGDVRLDEAETSPSREVEPKTELVQQPDSAEQPVQNTRMRMGRRVMEFHETNKPDTLPAPLPLLPEQIEQAKQIQARRELQERRARKLFELYPEEGVQVVAPQPDAPVEETDMVEEQAGSVSESVSPDMPSAGQADTTQLLPSETSAEPASMLEAEPSPQAASTATEQPVQNTRMRMGRRVMEFHETNKPDTLPAPLPLLPEQIEQAKQIQARRELQERRARKLFEVYADDAGSTEIAETPAAAPSETLAAEQTEMIDNSPQRRTAPAQPAAQTSQRKATPPAQPAVQTPQRKAAPTQPAAQTPQRKATPPTTPSSTQKSGRRFVRPLTTPVAQPRQERGAAPAQPTPLSDSTRRFLQPLVGIDPASVPVYRDAQADQIAAAHAAEAVTIDDQVMLSAGHNDDSPETLGLLAHEMTHVARNRETRFVPPLVQHSRTVTTSSADEEAQAERVEARTRQLARVRDAQALGTSLTDTSSSIGSSQDGIPGFADGQPREQQDSGSNADIWGGLPAPWEPLPSWVFNPAPTVTLAPATAPAARSANAPIAPVAPMAPIAPAATAAAPVVQRAGLERTIADGPEAATASQSAEAPEQAPEPDLDALAQQVYSILKQRLATERRRMG